ncbi:MAG: hypothetical protein JSR78_20050 [Proteobacteria bacterium]|nr:hypothetical protein [Pseudomonadota bacterium]
MTRKTVARFALAGVISALLSGWLGPSTDAWAKDKKSKSYATSQADPCAEPTKFVKDQLEKIRALQASQTTRPTDTVFSLFSSSTHVDHDTYAQIQWLRHDADTVNEMLRTGGCKTIDIDMELKNMPAPEPTPATPIQKKHRR